MVSPGSGVTLSALARELGLAKSTVSRALNDYPDIAPGTRARVQDAADRIGYRPSSTARNLKRGRVDTIGVVLSDDGPDLANPFFTLFLRGMTEAFEATGLDLVVAASPPGSDWRATYHRLIASRKVDGFVVTRTESRDPRIDFLRQRGIPFVAHGRTVNASAFAWIDMDGRAAFEGAVHRLAALGHRRIGLVGGQERMHFVTERRAGYRAACADLGLDEDPSLIVPGGLNADDGRHGAEVLLRSDQPPTALLCIRDEVAFGAMRAVAAHGLRVGADISVIGYDDVPHAAVTEPPLTTFSQDSESVGRRAAEMAAALINGASATVLQELRPPRLIARDSDRRASLGPSEIRAIVMARLNDDDIQTKKGEKPCVWQ